MLNHLVLYHADVRPLNNAAGTKGLRTSFGEAYFLVRAHVVWPQQYGSLPTGQPAEMGRTVRAGHWSQFGGVSGHLVVVEMLCGVS